MIKYLQKQIDEIFKDRGLRIFGGILALTHVFTFTHWFRNDFFVASQSALNAEPLCFPFFPNCDLFRALISDDAWRGILLFYLALAVLTFALFFKKTTLTLTYGLFASLTLFKLTLVLSNYGFTDGHNLMVLIASTLYLFVPLKKIALTGFIATFYFVSGLNKINFAWLAGATLIQPKIIGVAAMPWALRYVIILETVLVFALFHRNKWVRWSIVLQLAIMHLVSWPMVGFYAPLLSLSLLSLFLLLPKVPCPLHPQDGQRLSFIAFASLWLLFLLFQALPHISSNVSPVGGIYRLGSIEVAQTSSRCKSLLLSHQANESAHLQKPRKKLGAFFRCDPIVFLNQAHQLCRQNQETPEFKKLSLALLTRPLTSLTYQKVLDLKSVCQRDNPLWAEANNGVQP